jgi:hypothetical protein
MKNTEVLLVRDKTGTPWLVSCLMQGSRILSIIQIESCRGKNKKYEGRDYCGLMETNCNYPTQAG